MCCSVRRRRITLLILQLQQHQRLPDTAVSLHSAGACVGAGVDMVTAADLRYCTQSAYFCVKVGLLASSGCGACHTAGTRIGHMQQVEVAINPGLGRLQFLP